MFSKSYLVVELLGGQSVLLSGAKNCPRGSEHIQSSLKILTILVFPVAGTPWTFGLAARINLVSLFLQGHPMRYRDCTVRPGLAMQAGELRQEGT